MRARSVGWGFVAAGAISTVGLVHASGRVNDTERIAELEASRESVITSLSADEQVYLDQVRQDELDQEEIRAAIDSGIDLGRVLLVDAQVDAINGDINEETELQDFLRTLAIADVVIAAAGALTLGMTGESRYSTQVHVDSAGNTVGR